MKKVLLFLGLAGLFLGLSVKVEATNSSQLNVVENNIFDSADIMNLDISSGPILTRYWTDGWTAFGTPTAPAVKYFNGNNGYHGYLQKYKEHRANYGTQATYQGYFYHNSLPLPIPSYRPLIANTIVDEFE